MFLGGGLFRPHLPWHVPGKYFDLFPLNDIIVPQVPPDDLDDIPPIGIKFAKPNGDHASITGHHKWKEAVQGYLASIAFMDAQLGRLIDGFDRSPRARDTHIVLWSDHGWHLGEKLHWRKFSLWELSTPTNFSRSRRASPPPAPAQPARESPRSIPTLNQLCGLAARPELEGRSLMPLLRDPSLDWNSPVLTTYFRNNHSLRNERWRYTRYEDGGEELYDHRGDPMEWTNLATKPEYETIKIQMARWLPRVNAEDSIHAKGVAEE